MFSSFGDFKNIEKLRIGFLIKKIRKNKGIRQKDLEDERISCSTVSNIEKGEIANLDKLLYLITKLEMPHEEFSKLFHDESEADERRFLLLLGLEDIIEQLDVKKAKKFIITSDIMNEIDSDHPYYPYLCYLRGKMLYLKKSLEKAKKMYEESLKKVQTNPLLNLRNVEASCYCRLGYIKYLQNDFNKALEYTEKGLLSYQDNDDQTVYIKDMLSTNKVVFLQKLGELNTTSELFVNLWGKRNTFAKASTKSTLYIVQCSLLMEEERFREALDCTDEGINHSRVNKLKVHSFSLWSTKAAIYLKMGNLHLAEKCFESALHLGKKMSNKKLFIEPHAQLGLLYSKLSKKRLALEHINYALKLAEKYDDRLKLVDVLIHHGQIFMEQKHYQEAIVVLKRAKEISLNQQFTSKLPEILFKLAECYQETDNETEHMICLKERYEIEHTLDHEGS